MYNNIQKYYPRFLFFAKLVILFFAYRLVSQRILEESSYDFFLKQLSGLKSWAPWIVIFLLSITLLNWFIEILKWQKLVRIIRPISIGQAMKQSLSSLTISLITPNRIGEYGAKAMYYGRKERPRVLLLNFLGNFSQMGTTVIFGLLGFIWISDRMPEIALNGATAAKLGLFTLTVGIGLVLLGRLWKGFYSRLVSDLKTIPIGLHAQVLGLSLMKYLVFSHQFYFLLVVFGVDLGYLESMALLSLSYLISSLIPGFVLFDWLVKGSVAVAIFGRFGVDEIVVLSITSVMWLLNFGFPSLLGTLYVMAFKPTSFNKLAISAEEVKSEVRK